MNKTELKIVLGPPFNKSSTSIILDEITWFVGPNGSGKTKYAEALVNAFDGGKARFLRADRLAGLELTRSGYFHAGHFSQGFQKNVFESLKAQAEQFGYGADAIVLLEENYALRAMVEATLTQVFGRRIIFEWDSGTLKPAVQQKGQSTPYSLHQDECHGLKELVVLLTHLYDPSKEVLIIDEPELNLHPQFQGYVLEQVKYVARKLGKKVVLITHSPYMLDVRNESDLVNVYCFNGQGNLPLKISTVEGIEVSKVRRCLAQMNAHHRQVFFANYLIIVEGVYDRLILAAYLERLGISISAAGGTIIDVHGKDEIPFYLRLGEQLGKELFIVSDIDALFDGSIRRVLSKDPQLTAALSALGGGSDASAYIGTIQREIHALFDAIKNPSISSQSGVSAYVARLLVGQSNEPRNEAFLAKAILSHTDEVWAEELRTKVNSLRGRLRTIMNAFWRGLRVHFLERGELEDYLVNDSIGKPNYSDIEKQTLASNALKLLYDPSTDLDAVLPHIMKLKSYIDLLPKKLVVDYWIPLESLAREAVQVIQLYATTREIVTKQDLEVLLPQKFKKIFTVMQILEFHCEARAASGPLKFNGVLRFALQEEIKIMAFNHESLVQNMRLVSPQG